MSNIIHPATVCGTEVNVGDVVEITIKLEGRVELGYDRALLREDTALYLAGIPLSLVNTLDNPGIQVWVQTLEKAEPKWHSARVIKASIGDDVVYLLNADDYWRDYAGDVWYTDELSNVEVIVQ